MTKDELKKRNIFIKGSGQRNKVKPINVRSRGKNYIQHEVSVSDDFNDFFDYENELMNIKPAKEYKDILTIEEEPLLEDDTTSNEMVVSNKEEYFHITNEPHYSDNFIVMEKKSTKIEHEANNIKNIRDENKKIFEFIQCEFIKEDGDRCKKQAKKDHVFCSTHKRFLAKQS